MGSWPLLFAVVAVAYPGQGQELTLDEAIRIAEGNAFAIKLAQSNVEKTRQKINELRGQTGPKVNVNATRTQFDRGTSFQPSDATQANIQLTMPLDVLGVLGRSVRASQVALRAAEQQVETARNTLREQVRQAYYRVLQAEALVTVAEEALANSKERLEVTKKEVEAGSKAKIDIVRIETQIRQNEADLLAAQNGVRLAKQALNNTLGRAIETPFDPAEVGVLPMVKSQADELVAKAQSRRPDVQAQEFSIQSLALVRQAQESGLLPSLNLSAIHTQNVGDLGFGARRESTTGQLLLAVPVFDSGVTRSRVRAARQDEEQAKIQLDQLKLGISLEVRQALSNLADSWARFEVAQKGAELAQETYRLTKIRYDNDEAILLEVVDAQTELTRARSNVVRARYDYLAAYAALQKAVAADDPDAAEAGNGGGKN